MSGPRARLILTRCRASAGGPARAASDRRILGTVMATAGMLLISPDGLLIRLVESVGIWEIAFYRSLFMGLALALGLWLRYRRSVWQLWQGVAHLGILSSVLLAGVQIAFVGAFLNTTVANTLIIVATMPLFSAVFGWILIGERVQPRTWIAIAASLTGLGILVGDSLRLGNLHGDLMALSVAAMQGLNLVVLRLAGNRDMTASVCAGGFFGALIVLPFAAPLAISGRDLGLVAYLGFVQQPVALGLFLGSTRYIPAAEVALLTLLEAVLGPLWAWIGLGEVPSGAAFLGGAIILGALVGNTLAALRRRDTRGEGRRRA